MSWMGFQFSRVVKSSLCFLLYRNLNLETTEQILHVAISQAGRGYKYVNLSTHSQLHKKDKTLEGNRVFINN